MIESIKALQLPIVLCALIGGFWILRTIARKFFLRKRSKPAVYFMSLMTSHSRVYLKREFEDIYKVGITNCGDTFGWTDAPICYCDAKNPEHAFKIACKLLDSLPVIPSSTRDIGRRQLPWKSSEIPEKLSALADKRTIKVTRHGL